MKNVDSKSHVRGESIYLDDIPLVQGTLFACVYDSPVAHGSLKSVEIAEAEKAKASSKSLLAKDLIGENRNRRNFARRAFACRRRKFIFRECRSRLFWRKLKNRRDRAAKKIKAEIEPLEVVTDPRVAYAKNDLIVPPKHFKSGRRRNRLLKPASTFLKVAPMSNGQEHLYIETQGAYTIPTEQGGMRVYSSTQGPTAVQRCVSRVTALADASDRSRCARGSAAVSAARKTRRTPGRPSARSERS